MSARYRLHGLVVRSALALPELDVAATDAAVEVTITLEPSRPLPDDAPELAVTGDTAVLCVAGVAAYHVTGGRAISVVPVPGADPAGVRLFLLGSASGVLLHQRGLMLLHANLVVIGGQGVAFAGPSGAGKSTLTAACAAQGLAVLADDVAAVRMGAVPMAEAGPPRARLWPEAIEALGIAGTFPAVRAGLTKKVVPLRQGGGVAMPLGALFLLGPPGTPLARLSAGEGAAALVANTYRGHYLPLLGRSVAHWRDCVTLAGQVPVFRIGRAPDFAGLGAMIARVEAVCADFHAAFTR